MLSALTVLSAGADMRHRIELVVALSFNVLLQRTCLTFCNTSKKVRQLQFLPRYTFSSPVAVDDGMIFSSGMS